MILYFSGTGNSRFVAERIAAATSDKLFDTFEYIREEKGAAFTEPGAYVFVAPVYAAAPPIAFMEFIRRSQFPKACRAYFVVTCASGAGGSPAYCKKIASDKGFFYMGTAKVDMPQNYTPFFKIGTPEENKAKIDAALPVIDRIADAIRNKQALPDPGMKTWERVFTPLVLKPYYKWFVSAKPFTATDDCVGCDKCAKVCPFGNITLRDKKPVWGSRCTHCMACINLCPKDAIEYGNRTQGKPRYHGPNSLK